MTIVFTLFLRSRVAPCRMVAVASSLVGSLAASWAGSRAVLVKPVAKLTKLANRRIEIRRMLVLAKPVARRIEQLVKCVYSAYKETFELRYIVDDRVDWRNMVMYSDTDYATWKAAYNTNRRRTTAPTAP